MDKIFISLITCFYVFFPLVSSEATPWHFYRLFNSQLISQTSSTKEVQEEMLIEGMDKGILGDYQGAIEDFTEVIRLYPNSAEAYYNRGIAYTKLGDYQAAIADYNQAISFNPNLAEVYVDRAQVYSHLGNSSEALKDLQRAANLFKHQGNTIAYNQTLEMIKKLQ